MALAAKIRNLERKKEEDEERRGARGGADRHLMITGQRPCYGQMCSTGFRTDRQSVLH